MQHSSVLNDPSNNRYYSTQYQSSQTPLPHHPAQCGVPSQRAARVREPAAIHVTPPPTQPSYPSYSAAAPMPLHQRCAPTKHRALENDSLNTSNTISDEGIVYVRTYGAPTLQPSGFCSIGRLFVLLFICTACFASGSIFVAAVFLLPSYSDPAVRERFTLAKRFMSSEYGTKREQLAAETTEPLAVSSMAQRSPDRLSSWTAEPDLPMHSKSEPEVAELLRTPTKNVRSSRRHLKHEPLKLVQNNTENSNTIKGGD